MAEDGPAAPAAPYLYILRVSRRVARPRIRRGTRAAISAPSIGAVREIVHRLDPTRAVFGVKLVNDVVAGALDQPRLNASMLSMFAAAAIALASLGLYSLLMLLVAERSREMGVRMALGAAPSQVVALVFAGTGRLLGGGIAVGLALMAAVARVLHAALFGVSPLDAPTLGVTVLTLAVVTLLVSVVPARRAATIDPIASMRAE